MFVVYCLLFVVRWLFVDRRAQFVVCVLCVSCVFVGCLAVAVCWLSFVVRWLLLVVRWSLSAACFSTVVARRALFVVSCFCFEEGGAC